MCELHYVQEWVWMKLHGPRGTSQSGVNVRRYPFVWKIRPIRCRAVSVNDSKRITRVLFVSRYIYIYIYGEYLTCPQTRVKEVDEKWIN